MIDTKQLISEVAARPILWKTEPNPGIKMIDTEQLISEVASRPTLWKHEPNPGIKMIDTEQLISEVAARPILWNHRSDLYKEKELKQETWVEITKMFFDDYEYCFPEMRKKLVERVQQRWKSARDQYIRSKTKPKSYKYVFAHLCTFLDSTVTNEIQENVNINSSSLTEPQPTNSRGAAESTPEQSEADYEYTEVDVNPTSTLHKPKRRRYDQPSKFEKSLLDILKSQNTGPDEDVLFFNSLLSNVRRLNDNQKLRFRCGVMQCLLDLNSENDEGPTRNHAHLDDTITTKEEALFK